MYEVDEIADKCLLLVRWYKKQEQAFRMGYVVVILSLTSCRWLIFQQGVVPATEYVSVISPLINYGLGHITGSLSPWHYMCLFAGSITILWSFVILFFLQPDPVRGKKLAERER